MLILLDAIARRYGKTPDECLNMTPYQLGLAVLCLKAHDDLAGTIVKRLNAEGMPCFPVMIVQQ